ncbi:MAG: endolytic transglycosylase MltG [Spirochaetota bacterium]
MRKIAFSGAFVCLILFLAYLYFNSPPHHSLKLKSSKPGHSSPHSFIVYPGESVKSVAGNLKNEGLIRSEFFFTSLVRIHRATGKIKAGEYSLDNSWKTTRIIDTLLKGIVKTCRFTVPEGLTMKQIAELLDNYGIVNTEDFLKACYDQEILKRYKIPFSNVEGFLFPDTYTVAKGVGASQIVGIMIEKFYEELDAILFQDYEEEELKKVVIIASLVEREAKIDSERPIVAAVFYNRLKKNKRLESCATVQYILGKTKETLLYRDLKVNSPYNTYLYSGLPPGPIANPGIKSIEAAVRPADVDYLFFVSKGDGSHHFSKTYTEHLKAIEKYNASGSIGHHIS